MHSLSKRRPTASHERVDRLSAGAWGLSLAPLLSACSGAETPDAASSPVSTGPAGDTQLAPAAAAPATTLDPGNAAARGELALREQRLFLAPGDSAFALFLAAAEAKPEDERSRLALQDLLIYAALHIEQRLAANDAEEAARMLALWSRASSDARRCHACRPASRPRGNARPALAQRPNPPLSARRYPAAPAAAPALAERRRPEDLVEIELAIDADGSASQLEVLRSQLQSVFGREALAAMARWRFAPPQSPMRARRTLEFKQAR